MKVRITFKDEVKAKTMIQAYDDFLDYLKECVNNEDVTAFDFQILDPIK